MIVAVEAVFLLEMKSCEIESVCVPFTLEKARTSEKCPYWPKASFSTTSALVVFTALSPPVSLKDEGRD